MEKLITSGEVASQVGLERWKLLYLIEKGDLPNSTFSVPGRRLFTEEDVQRIKELLQRRSGSSAMTRP